MRNTFLSRAIAFGAALGIWLLSVPAMAVSFDFRTGGATVFSGGTLAQSGINFVGANIPIDLVEVAGSSNGKDGVFEVNGPVAILDSSGNPTGDTAGSLNFDTSGSLLLTGSVPGLGINSNINLISSGSFASFSKIGSDLLAATGPDTKADALLSAVGASGSNPFQFTASVITMGAISSTPSPVISTDLKNTSSSTVPEPGSLLLLGSGLVGVALAARRKKTK